MKIAFFSESLADEAALKIIVAGILGEEIEETDLPNTMIQRSSSHVDKLLPSVINAIHYGSNAEALIVVSDSDDTLVHVQSHEEEENDDCRICKLRKIISETVSKLQEVPGKEIIKVAIGVPVPAIEAWYLCGVNGQVNEVAWIRKQNGGQVPYDRKSLKIELYGSDRPSIETLREKAVESAERLVENLEQLEDFFPQGFGCLTNEVRNWKK